MALRRLLEKLHQSKFRRAGLLALPLALLTTIAMAPGSNTTLNKASPAAPLVADSEPTESAWRDVAYLPSGVMPNGEDRANLPWFATYSNNVPQDTPLDIAAVDVALTGSEGTAVDSLLPDSDLGLAGVLQAWVQTPSSAHGAMHSMTGSGSSFASGFTGGGSSNLVAANGASSGKSTARHPGQDVRDTPADELPAGEIVPHAGDLPAPTIPETEPDSHQNGKPPAGDPEGPVLIPEIPWNVGTGDGETEVHAVPEPGTLGLWILGLAACFLFHRRASSRRN